jgi:membrane protein DedA with SNARE-associated domain
MDTNSFGEILNKIIQLISELGYAGVSIVVGLEYACFPIPSEVVLPFIGMTASKASFSYLGAILFSVIGGIVGSIFCYLLGYYGGNPLLNWLFRRFPSSRKSIEALNKWFDKYGKIAVFGARLVPLTRTYVSILAGAVKLNIISFTLYSLAGIVLWNTVLISIGYYVGENWAAIEGLMADYSVAVIILALLAAGTLIYKKKK